MRKKTYFTFLCTLIFASSLQSQYDALFYNDVMANAYLPETRMNAGVEFNKLFFELVKQENSFNLNLSDYKWVSVKYPSDKSFRIVTWLVEGDDATSCYGFIQTKDGKIIELKDQGFPLEDGEYLEMEPEYWLGALYYNMIEREIEGVMHYYLFGYNSYNAENQVKIIDDLYFENGNPKFGGESFIEGSNAQRPVKKNRIILTYYDKANVNSNFNSESNMIIHDYLIVKEGISESGMPVYVPDGSYVGYEWKSNGWHQISKLPVTVQTEKSILQMDKQQSGGDIFRYKKGTKKRD
jgi:hypothetical protein